MITVGICESGDKIRQLANQFFSKRGFFCSSSNDNNEADFIFSQPDTGTHYDILIENKVLNSNAYADYIHLINTDDVNDLKTCSESIVITYGLNHFATATASSISETDNSLSFQYCLQRSIVNLKGKIIECQEFPVCLYNTDCDIQSAIAFTTLALILGFIF